MKKLLNTLYVTSENSYLGLDGENIVVFEEDKEKGRLPHEGTWIEIRSGAVEGSPEAVVPHEGTWIEI